MRVLFDKNVPVPLRQSLKHHQVRTAEDEGWGTLSNGELITEAENAGFDLLLTCDQNVSTNKIYPDDSCPWWSWVLIFGRTFDPSWQT